MRSLMSVFSVLIAVAIPVTTEAKGEHHASAPKPHHESMPKPPQQHHESMPKPPQQHHANAPRSTPTYTPQMEAMIAGGYVQHHGYQHRGSYRGYSYYHHRYTPHNNMASFQKTRMRHLLKLKADLDSIAKGATVSTSHVNTLQHDLNATVVGGTIRPAPPAVQQLSSDLFGAVSRRTRPGLDSADLALVLETAMNASALPAGEIEQALSSGTTLLKASGVSRPDSDMILKDLKAVAFGTANQAAALK